MIDLEPSPKEKRIITRCMNEQDVVYGDTEYIWSQPSAYRMLATMRLCLDAIVNLANMHHEVNPSFIVAVVMQTNDMGEPPFGLTEMAEHLCTNTDARAYWVSMMTDGQYPHRCPFCGAAAYIGLRMIECKSECRG
jgi:hypothetical protein